VVGVVGVVDPVEEFVRVLFEIVQFVAGEPVEDVLVPVVPDDPLCPVEPLAVELGVRLLPVALGVVPVEERDQRACPVLPVAVVVDLAFDADGHLVPDGRPLLSRQGFGTSDLGDRRGQVV